MYRKLELWKLLGRNSDFQCLKLFFLFLRPKNWKTFNASGKIWSYMCVFIYAGLLSLCRFSFLVRLCNVRKLNLQNEFVKRLMNEQAIIGEMKLKWLTEN